MEEAGATSDRAMPDPFGASLDALSDHLRAERWLVALRSGKGWDVRSSEPSHRDDLLISLAEALAGGDGLFVYESPELGHAGLRLATAGVSKVVVLVAGAADDAVVTFFENPSDGAAESLSEHDVAETLARMTLSARDAYESLARVAELRAIDAWLPWLARLADGEIEECEALCELGRLGTAATLISFRPDREHLEVSWAALEGGDWDTGSNRLRSGQALRIEVVANPQANTIAKLVGLKGDREWSIGRSHGGTVLLASGDLQEVQSIASLANLLDAASTRGRDTSATRNNAMLTERARIAGVIHEGITQVLTNVAIQMEILDQVMEDPEAARKMVRAMRAAVLEALDSLRGAILELTPNAPDWTDLAQGLERFVGDFGAQWGLELTYEVEGAPRDVDPDVVALVFGLVQEALSNIRKHAGVEEALVRLNFTDDSVSIEIVDEGKGFDPADRSDEGYRQHQGLQIVRSRVRLAGGRLAIDSTPGKGTTMSLEVSA